MRLVTVRTRKVVEPPMTSIPSGANPLLSSMTVSRPGMMGQVAGSAWLGRDDELLDADAWPSFLPVARTRHQHQQGSHRPQTPPPVLPPVSKSHRTWQRVASLPHAHLRMHPDSFPGETPVKLSVLVTYPDTHLVDASLRPSLKSLPAQTRHLDRFSQIYSSRVCATQRPRCTRRA